jgi:hypothetical protein
VNWIGTLPLALGIWLFFVTGIGSYWFHPKSLSIVRQNRAVALSYYACGPLAYLPVPLFCFATHWFLESENMMGRGGFFQLAWILFFGWMFGPLLLLPFYVNTLRLLQRTTQAGAGRVVLAAVGIPISWALCAIFTFGLFPWIVGYGRLVWQSFVE